MSGDSRRTLVFIGDSVTAAGRDPMHRADLGEGFVALIAEELSTQGGEPAANVMNTGVGGDRARDVEARWENDCLAHRPDVITLLVGVNDTWRRFDRGQRNSVSEYASSLRRMLDSAREQCSASIVLVEPFLLNVGFVAPEWSADLAPRRAAVADLAQEYKACFVPTQAAFDDAAGVDPSALLHDGVHPTPAGHRLIADCWLASRAACKGKQ